MHAPKTGNEPSERYCGFSLKSVCWGYRDIFRDSIEHLFERGLLGRERQAVTESFFKVLKNADQSCYDHVLKKFLGALNTRTQWIMDLPGVFTDIAEMGHELALEKPHYGVAFFGLLEEGAFGDTPEQVRHLLTQIRRLREIDTELALAFAKGYQRLIASLTLRETELYLEVGLKSFAHSRRAGIAFMDGSVESSETYIRSISNECRLADVSPVATALLHALSGREIEIQDIGSLDTDDLIERGCNCVFFQKWLYVPSRIRRFGAREANRRWYLLATSVAAAMSLDDSFCRIQGRAEFATCEDVVGTDTTRVNLFCIVEWTRVLRRACERWPGIRKLYHTLLDHELSANPPANAPERLLAQLLQDTHVCEAAAKLSTIANASINLFDTATALSPELVTEAKFEWPGLDEAPIRPLSFLPDFLFPATVSTAPSDGLVADLKRAAEGKHQTDEQDKQTKTAEGQQADGSDKETDGEEEQEAVPACYVYDEWSHDANDYLKDYCFVHQIVAEPLPNTELPPDVLREGRRVSKVFERLKPDVPSREKLLEDGETINADRLTDFLVNRRLEPSPRVDFYEKPRIQHRDLAVLILLDVSGSTGETTGDSSRIIEIEKHAALILGQGLHTLGDRFSICGFSSNGRENCLYTVYKEFDTPWDRNAMRCLMGATPVNSTRIGPALRHSGYRLEPIAAKQRLIILVTDGRPMDSGYDPNTRYAQHDVRMACQENAAKAIHTFAITTEENSLADMEIMFPGRRFAILPDLRRLPQILPRLYTRITV